MQTNMNTQSRKWFPIALCCLPGITLAVIVGIGLITGSAVIGNVFGGPAGIGLIALAFLACPVGMGLMVRRKYAQHTPSGGMQHSCCVPEQHTAATERDLPSDRLVALRERRETLEHEIQKEYTK